MLMLIAFIVWISLSLVILCLILMFYLSYLFAINNIVLRIRGLEVFMRNPIEMGLPWEWE